MVFFSFSNFRIYRSLDVEQRLCGVCCLSVSHGHRCGDRCKSSGCIFCYRSNTCLIDGYKCVVRLIGYVALECSIWSQRCLVGYRLARIYFGSLRCHGKGKCISSNDYLDHADCRCACSVPTISAAQAFCVDICGTLANRCDHTILINRCDILVLTRPQDCLIVCILRCQNSLQLDRLANSVRVNRIAGIRINSLNHNIRYRCFYQDACSCRYSLLCLAVLICPCDRSLDVG